MVRRSTSICWRCGGMVGEQSRPPMQAGAPGPRRVCHRRRPRPLLHILSREQQSRSVRAGSAPSPGYSAWLPSGESRARMVLRQRTLRNSPVGPDRHVWGERATTGRLPAP
jgi:hypothetical protein